MCLTNNEYTVYEHIFPNGKRYIGITCVDVHERWEKNGNGYKTQIVYKAIKKYGWNNIEHNIVCTGLTKEEACKKEQELIAFYKSNSKHYGYNCTSGGEAGTHPTDESRERMREAQRRLVEKGKKISEEARIAARNRLLGTKRPRDQVEKAAAKMRGRPHPMSETTRLKICEVLRNMPPEKKVQWRANISKGRRNAVMKPRNGKEVIKKDIKTGEIICIYRSLCHMEHETGHDRKYVGQICKRTYKDGRNYAFGYIWEFGDVHGHKK